MNYFVCERARDKRHGQFNTTAARTRCNVLRLGSNEANS